MTKEFDFIIAAIAIVCGVLLLTGNGAFLMKGGNEAERNRKYDQKKMERVCGIGALVLGISTLIDSFVNNVTFTICNLIFTAVLIVWLFWYIKNRCKKE